MPTLAKIAGRQFGSAYDAGDVSIFVCEALVDFSTAPRAAPYIEQERAARWESRFHFNRSL